jgi:hypothetical protein
MLGLPEPQYRAVRDDLLAGVVAAIGSPRVDAARLAEAARTHALGIDI